MSKEKFEHISTDLIDPPRLEMRTDLDEEALQDLVASIKDNGIIQPLVVRPVGKRYEIIAGRRRLAAAKLVKLAKVPAIVREADDRTTAVLRIHENLVRDDVDVLSEALFIVNSIQELGISETAFAAMINRSPNYVFDRIEIADMPDYLQQALKTKSIKLGVALNLNRIGHEPTRKTWTETAIRDGCSVRASEAWLKQYQDIEERQIEENPGIELPAEPVPLQEILVACARCGEHGQLQEMTLVRVHKACPELPNIPDKNTG